MFDVSPFFKVFFVILGIWAVMLAIGAFYGKLGYAFKNTLLWFLLSLSGLLIGWLGY
jgi:hypothetical protein